jgi:hypothetical protein
MFRVLRFALPVIGFVALLMSPWLSPVATVVAAPAGSSEHTLVLRPQVGHTGVEDFRSDNLFDGSGTSCNADELLVGYFHTIDVNIQDSWENCVYQTGVRFDVSPLHDYPGAVVTDARLSYQEDFRTLLLPDGHPAANPYDLNGDAVWGSCVARLTVPTADWRNDIGLTPNQDDELIDRLDSTSWTVTNQVNHWYFEPDYQNFGLLLLGYDEGDQFSNRAACLSAVSDFRLTLQFTSNDTPDTAQRALDNRRAAIGPVPTAAPAVDSSRAVSLVPTATPLPANPNGVKPARPDLVISSVETSGQKDARGLTPLCSAGQSTTFTVHVKNVGLLATTDAAVVSLSIDGVPQATATVDALPTGAEKTAVIGAIVLAAGTHTFTVTVNEGQKIPEGDFSNNTFTQNKLTCQ